MLLYLAIDGMGVGRGGPLDRGLVNQSSNLILQLWRLVYWHAQTRTLGIGVLFSY